MVKKTDKTPTNLDDIWPNSTLDSDWDILAKIWKTILELEEGSRPNIVHIKGHQDKDKQYAELDLPAQLNVDADKLADQYIAANPNKNYREVPLLPTSGAQLNLPEGTATHKYKRELRLARTTEPLRQKLMTRNNWTVDVLEDIDWEAYRRALNRHHRHRTSLIKYHHGILPVGKHVHQYDKKYPESCPSCTAPTENQDHLHRCPSRQQWRTKCLQDMRAKVIEPDTHPGMADLLLAGLRAVLQGDTSDTIEVPQGLEELAAAQEAIGWDQLLKGRITIGWSDRQEQYRGNNSTAKDNGLTWATDITSALISQWWDLWELRNDDRHGRDRRSQQQAETRQAVRELYQLYDLKPFIPDRFQWILATSVEQRLQWPTYAIRAFINSYKPILEADYSEDLVTG